MSLECLEHVWGLTFVGLFFCASTELFNGCVDGSLIICWFSDQGKWGLERHSWRPQSVWPAKHMSRWNGDSASVKMYGKDYIMTYFYELKSIFKHELAFSWGQILHTQIDTFDRVLWFCWLWHRVCVRICQKQSGKKMFQLMTHIEEK